MFERARELWSRYDRRFNSDRDSRQLHISGGVYERLEQLDILLRYFAPTDDALEAASREGRSTTDSWDEIVLFGEAFYFFAWRIRELLHRTGEDELPGMGKRIDFPGINLVRNQLLEHPERHGRTPARHFALGTKGLVLKPSGVIAGEGQDANIRPGDDPGFIANAEELRDRLASRLEEILAITDDARPRRDQIVITNLDRTGPLPIPRVVMGGKPLAQVSTTLFYAVRCYRMEHAKQPVLRATLKRRRLT